MKIYTHSLIALLLLGTATVQAEKPSRFEAHPEEQRRFTKRIKERQAKDRQEVEAWSKKYGVPIREKRGHQIIQLMAIRDGVPLYYTTLNKYAGISTAANQVRNTAPYSLNGSGITIGVWDGGSARTSHDEFGSRVTSQGSDYSATGISAHATHVTGTIAASGVDSNAIGMAPSITVHSYGWDYDITEMTSAAASQANQSGKIYLSNHSYGLEYPESLFGQYISGTHDIDVLVHGKRYYLPFVSAGNEQSSSGTGYDTISYYGAAKNVMTVGAVRDATSGTTRSVSAATMTSFSSWGPIDDGRIKPDIVANGYELYSTYSSGDSSYIQNGWSGTSMSCPNASGSAALLVEYYKELFSSSMWASTLKGLIIHTADDLGNNGPDYKFGWGLMNTKEAVDLLTDYADNDTSRLTEAELTTADSSHTYTVLVGDEPLRVTLCWTDPAASVNSDTDPDLINDLNLRVVSAGGTTTYPYKLDKASPGSSATRGVNDVDNVEQVYIATPSAGLYTITVDFAGSLQGGEQEYSLLMSGISSDSDGDDMPDYWEKQYFSSTTGAVATADLDKDGSDNLTEYIAGTLPNDATSVFKVTTYSADANDGIPFTLNWTPVLGRIYSVYWSNNLQYNEFEDNKISDDLPHPISTFTDTDETHAGNAQFYRVDVRLDD